MKRHSKRRFLILLIFVACAVTILVSVFMNYNENGMEKINRGHVNKMVVKIENEAKEIENKVSESSIEMVTVFLNEDVSEEYAVEIEEQIKTIIGVKTCKYFTKEEAWNQFADKYFGGNTSQRGLRMIILRLLYDNIKCLLKKIKQVMLYRKLKVLLELIELI